MTPSESTRRLPVYLLLQPVLSARRVLHLAGSERGTQLLARRAGRVIDAGPQGSVRCTLGALPLGSGSCDLVVAPTLLDSRGAALQAALSELRRVLSSRGMAALVASQQQDYWRVREHLTAHFAQVALLAQAPLAGFYLSYLEPAVAADALELHDELAGEPEAASHFIALVAQTELPRLDAYSLVTLPASELAAAESPRQVPALRAGREPSAELALARGKREREGLLHQLVDAQQQAEHLRQRVGDAERAATQVALEHDRVQQQREAVAERALWLEAELQRLTEERREQAAALERSQREQEALARQIEHGELQLIDLRDAQESQREQLTALYVERDRLRERLLSEEEERHREARERARAEQRAAGLVTQLGALDERLAASREAEREQESLRDELTRTSTACEVLQQELRGLHGERRDLFVALREQREARAELERGGVRERREAQNEREALRQQLIELEAELVRSGQEGELLQAALARREEELARAAALHEALVVASAGYQQQAARLAQVLQQLAEDEDALHRSRGALDDARAQAARFEQTLAEQEAELAAQAGAVEALRNELEEAARALVERERIEAQLEAAAARERRDLFYSERRCQAGEARLAQLERERQHEAADLRHELLVAVAAQEQQADELAVRLEEQAAEHALEVDVRAAELAYALERMEQLEGRFWQASDEATRHAARVAAAAASVENERLRQEGLERRVAALEAALAQAELAAREAADSAALRVGELQGTTQQRVAEAAGLRAQLEQQRQFAEARLEELHWQTVLGDGRLWHAGQGAERRAALAAAQAEELWWRGERLAGELWRRARAHQDALARLTEQEARLRGAAEQVDLRRDAELRLEASAAEVCDLHAQVDELDGRVEALRQLLEQQEGRIAELVEEASVAEEERSEAVARAEGLADELGPLRQRELDLRAVSTRLSTEARALVARYEAAVAEAGPLRAALVRAGEEQAALREELERSAAAHAEATLAAAAAASLRAELDGAHQHRSDLEQRLVRANELLEAQSATLAQLKEVRLALKEARAERARDQQRAERAVAEHVELQQQLLEARRQQAEQRQRDRAQHRRLEQRVVEAETARKRAHARAVQQDEARRAADRQVGGLRELVLRLGGDPATAPLAASPTDVDDTLLADDWHGDLGEAPSELRDALAQELAPEDEERTARTDAGPLSSEHAHDFGGAVPTSTGLPAIVAQALVARAEGAAPRETGLAMRVVKKGEDDDA